jgi:F0F1-type ATP synthase assembly protein I
MSKRLGAFASLVVIAAVYLVLVGIKWDWLIPENHVAGIIGLLTIFFSSTAIMMSGSNASAESRAQRFILGTAIQMILVLFFVLIVKYLWKDSFKEFVWYFMSFFVIMLFTQAIWMLLKVRKN